VLSANWMYRGQPAEISNLMRSIARILHLSDRVMREILPVT
jgi:hypothetical protein